MDKLFFDSWESLLRSFIITILAYLAMVFLLRISGKRTLSKMNAFDFVGTVALGSALATVALNKDVVLADGILVFCLLIILQFGLASLSYKFPFIKRMVTNQPSLLLFRGEVLHHALKKERITISDLNLSAREKGISSLKEIDAIILETNGDITIIKDLQLEDKSTLSDVNFPKLPEID